MNKNSKVCSWSTLTFLARIQNLILLPIVSYKILAGYWCRCSLHVCLPNMRSAVTGEHTYFPSPSDLEYWSDLIFQWASLGLPSPLMNSLDRKKGARGGFVVRCKAGWEGPVRQGKQVEERRRGRTAAVSSIMFCSTEGSAGPWRVWVLQSHSTTAGWKSYKSQETGTSQSPSSYLSGTLRCCVEW